MGSRIGSYPQVAEPFHVDFKGNLTLTTLGTHLLNCAGFHSSERGFGMATLHEENHTWVLSRLAIELSEFPRQYEAFTVQTWVEDVYKLFTNRNYAVLNQAGEPIGYARSIWAMINMESRKPIDLAQLHGENIANFLIDVDCPIEKPARIKPVVTSESYRHEAKYGDIDINNHVNSIKYMEHILNLFPLAMYQTHQIKRFEIAYVQESYVGETLTFHQEMLASNEFGVEVKRDGNDTLCRAKITFKELTRK